MTRNDVHFDSNGLQPVVRTDVRADDRNVVRRIVESTGFFSAAETDVAVELVDERLAKGLASGYHFVFLEVADTVVGYASFGPIACTVHSYDLYWIAVDSSFQGQGFGLQLVKLSEASIQSLGGRRVYIETSGRDQYLPTRGFYTRCGYSEAAVLTDFYDAGDDKIVYVKVI